MIILLERQDLNLMQQLSKCDLKLLEINFNQTSCTLASRLLTKLLALNKVELVLPEIK